MSLSTRTCRAGQTRRRRAHLRTEIRRENAAYKPNRNQFVRVACVPAETLRLQIQIQASHHRAFHAGAVLGVINALRFASTRPTAGPSGIDDASARHVSGNCAMVAVVPIARTSLTRKSRGRMLASSRQCRTALLRSPQGPAERASGRRPQGTASSAFLSTSQFVARQPRTVGRHAHELRNS